MPVHIDMDSPAVAAFAVSQYAPWFSEGGLPVHHALGCGRTVRHIPWADRHRQGLTQRTEMVDYMRKQLRTRAFRDFEREWRKTAERDGADSVVEDSEAEDSEELTQQCYGDDNMTQPDDDSSASSTVVGAIAQHLVSSDIDLDGLDSDDVRAALALRQQQQASSGGPRRSARAARQVVPFDPSTQDALHKQRAKEMRETRLADDRSTLAALKGNGRGRVKKTRSDYRKGKAAAKRVQAAEAAADSDATDSDDGGSGIEEGDGDGVVVYGLKCGRYPPGTQMEAVQLWAWQIENPSGQYKETTWDQVKGLLPKYAAEVRLAYDHAGRAPDGQQFGKKIRFGADGNRRRPKSKRTSRSSITTNTGADVPREARTTIKVPYQYPGGYCAPDAVANVMPAELASAPVVVDGTSYPSMHLYLRSFCRDGDVWLPKLAVAAENHNVQAARSGGGDGFQLRKWRRPSGDLHAIAYYEGALVVADGNHVVGIKDGLLFDNDPDFPKAVNLRVPSDPPERLESLWRDVLQLDPPLMVREVVVALRAKKKKRKHVPHHGGGNNNKRQRPLPCHAEVSSS